MKFFFIGKMTKRRRKEEVKDFCYIVMCLTTLGFYIWTVTFVVIKIFFNINLSSQTYEILF